MNRYIKNFHENRSINNLLSNTYNSKSEYLATMEGSLPKKKKILLSILFMLFWLEEINIKEKILMIFFMLYLCCLNDKEKKVKIFNL